MKPLRVGIVCFPTFGGSGVVATEIGLGLSHRGHRVHVFSYETPARIEHFDRRVILHQVESHAYPVLHQVPYALALASKLVEVARRDGLDVIHAHYAVPHATSAYLACQILGKEAPALVTTLHGTDITLVGSDATLQPITRFSVLAAQALTTPSRFLRAETYARLDINPDVAIDVVPNFVDSARFAPPAPGREGTTAERARHILGLGQGGAGSAAGASTPRVLTHVSNFRPLKRVGDVIRIFATVRRATDARLVLVGDGPEHASAMALARELGVDGDVIVLGKQPSFVEILQASDVFLLPSETESFGLAALEAMACGVPVVASKVGGLPEVVRHGHTGYLEPVGDVAAMAARVLSILGDSDLRRRLGTEARADVEAHFGREPALDAYQAIYQRVRA